MTTRTKWITGAISAIVICVAVVLYASRYSTTITGVAAVIADVPHVGKLLPNNLTVSDIRFRSYGASGEVLLRASASEKDFDAIVAHWQTNAVRYKSGFRYPGPVTESDFKPDGDRMYVGTATVPAASRQNAWVFFEPGASGERGKLYLHVLR